MDARHAQMDDEWSLPWSFEAPKDAEWPRRRGTTQLDSQGRASREALLFSSNTCHFLVEQPQRNFSRPMTAPRRQMPERSARHTVKLRWPPPRWRAATRSEPFRVPQKKDITCAAHASHKARLGVCSDSDESSSRQPAERAAAAQRHFLQRAAQRPAATGELSSCPPAAASSRPTERTSLHRSQTFAQNHLPTLFG